MLAHIISMFSEYYLYVFAGILAAAVIIHFLKSNSEEFPYPDECFSCNNNGCKRCAVLKQQKLSPRGKKLHPSPLQPEGCLQYVESRVSMDSENFAKR